MKEKLSNSLGRIIKQQRIMRGLVLGELGLMSGVSQSYLARIERGERFPSAHVLRKIAKPLGFEEDELFALAGYLSPHHHSVAESRLPYSRGELDPYVATVLSQEPPKVQRTVLTILSILKSMTEGTTQQNSGDRAKQVAQNTNANFQHGGSE
jgi:transcriptional regulator with XRE-family HTH domain